MTHDGANLDKHLTALQEHSAARTTELRDIARASAVELEAERTAAEDKQADGHHEPPEAA